MTDSSAEDLQFNYIERLFAEHRLSLRIFST